MQNSTIMSPDRPVAIAAHDIHKCFGQLEVLSGISLEARKGDVVSIIGSSGSGKSTFLRCLNLLEVPDKGTLVVGNEHLEFMSLANGKRAVSDRRQAETIRRKTSMVFQGFNLWHHMTVLANIIEAPIHVHKQPRKEAIEKARELLNKVGLSQREDYYPAQLSGGQQQRAAIARALAVDPDVILFDEPTSALDPELVGEVLKVMGQLAAEGRTMIVVTHEMSFARDVSTHAVFLHMGRLEEEGSPAEMFSRPNSPRLAQFLSSYRNGGFGEQSRVQVPSGGDLNALGNQTLS
jgi:arginine/ornithine transport system ATP-binding protein